MAEIDFTCPACGDSVLVEAILMKEYWTLGEIYKDGWHEQAELIDSEGSSIGGSDFVCNSCGYYVACSDEDLWNWLEEHDMLILGDDDGENN